MTYGEWFTSQTSPRPHADAIIVNHDGCRIWARRTDANTKVARLAMDLIYIEGLGWFVPMGEVLGVVEQDVMDAAHAEALAEAAQHEKPVKVSAAQLKRLFDLAGIDSTPIKATITQRVAAALEGKGLTAYDRYGTGRTEITPRGWATINANR